MKKLVMAFGSFDILHPGHLLYLKSARKLGDRLMVVVARDRSIEMTKNRKPVVCERDRLKMVRALRAVDMAVLGNKINSPNERLRIIMKYRPDVIAFGYDQNIDVGEVEDWLGSHGIRSKVVRIKAVAKEKEYKSSIIKRRIMEG